MTFVKVIDMDKKEQFINFDNVKRKKIVQIIADLKNNNLTPLFQELYENMPNTFSELYDRIQEINIKIQKH